jgi:hypothetical protein
MILRTVSYRRIPGWLICGLLCAGSLLCACTAQADPAAFDLLGPSLEVNVTRGDKTLPIAEVASLQSGDRIWIHPDFPESQSVHYLLIVAFLRGTTNPPPENWFTRVETWNKNVRTEGIVVTVPPAAQQVLLFLAPETGGDFATLRSAVRGRPGSFVRASQDLNEASLERSRLDRYLSEIKQASDSEPKALQQRSEVLARTLNIKIDQGCFYKPEEQQAPCLMQNTDQLVLDDGHTQSMVAALTAGPSTDLIGAVSATPLAGGGSFSPYVGAIVDMARIMGTLHTAEYQYIPALALPRQNHLNLRLNSPPSFRNPKSVLVIGLPAVEAPQLPPLRAMNPDEVLCLQKTALVLPVQGAPLVFSTTIAHDFVLRVPVANGQTIDLPATADAAHGGFTIDIHALPPGTPKSQVKGTLRGFWGFEAYEGPSFNLRAATSGQWAISPEDRSALIADREDTLHLKSECAVCVDQVTIENAQGKNLNATWKIAKPDELEVRAPLKGEAAGPVKVKVKQFGLNNPDEIQLIAYSEAAHLDHFLINTGDRQGVLTGTRLDEVQKLKLDGVEFVPGKLSRADQKDELPLLASNSAVPLAEPPHQKLVAYVSLKDGRVLNLQTTVEPARPKVNLIGKSIQTGPTGSAIRFASQDQLPQDGQMSFFLKTEIPEKFPRTEKIEVANEDESFSTLLSISDGNLILQDSQTVLGTLVPLKNFGPSAFGALRFRAIGEDGTKGDWQPLADLVRVPSLKEIRCPDSPDKPCKLGGTNLFLIDSVASDSQFTHTTPVPLGFADSTLTVPRPNGTLLYIKLRDDPSIADTIVLPVLPEAQ